jgi:hypothetical protein
MAIDISYLDKMKYTAEDLKCCANCNNMVFDIESYTWCNKYNETVKADYICNEWEFNIDIKNREV